MPASQFIYVVDDDEAARDLLSLSLEARGYTVRSFGGAAISRRGAGLASWLPDCRYPHARYGRARIAAALGRASSPFPLIVITGHGDVPLAVRAMKAGAVDFIEKPFAADTILNSAAAALNRLARPRDQDPVAAERLGMLTPREREVLLGLLAGLPNKSIAYDLAISPRTVEVHRARIMDKMGARSLSELIRMSLAAGILPPVN